MTPSAISRRLLVPELMEYRPRSEVEDDPSLKQIIPYVVLRCDDAVFCYTRGKSQGEARLHRRRSLGVGGHVAEADAEGRRSFEAYEMAMRRELDEEVEVKSPGAMRLVGLINDDSTPVGQVHLGVVHVLELERPLVSPREDGLADCEFVPIAKSARSLGRVRDLVTDLHRSLPASSVREGSTARGSAAKARRLAAGDRAIRS